MTATESDNLALRRYLAAVASGATGDTLARFYAPGVVQEEFPNRLLANGARRDLAAILAAAVGGQSVMTSQSFDVLNAVAHGDRVALEVQWIGTLAIPLGPCPPATRCAPASPSSSSCAPAASSPSATTTVSNPGERFQPPGPLAAPQRASHRIRR